jgi:topoisomerase-4 subunit A
LAHTSLEASVSVNLVSVGLDGRPGQKSLEQMLREWLEFRLATITRRTRHRLDRVDDRMHILEGRQRILLDIDRVIRIIRESDEPKAALIQSFALSERQADDVLEIRLRQLARLEAIRIDQELQALGKEKATLEALLASPQAMRRQLVREIEADAKQFGDDRRTLIEEAQRASAEIKLAAEPVTVILSERGWVRARQGHGHDWAQFAFKPGDSLHSAHEVMTTDHLFALASNGRVYSIPVSQLPSARGDGVPLTSLVDLEPGSRVDHGLAASAEDGVLLTSSGGVGFICQAGDLVGRTRQGKAFISLDEGDQPLRPVRFIPGMGRVMLVSDSGRALVLDLSEVKVLRNGGRGVALLGLDKGESLEATLVYGSDGLVLSGVGRGAKPLTKALSASALESFLGTRARKGRLIEPRVRQVRLSLPRILPKT